MGISYKNLKEKGNRIFVESQESLVIERNCNNFIKRRHKTVKEIYLQEKSSGNRGEKRHSQYNIPVHKEIPQENINECSKRKETTYLKRNLFDPAVIKVDSTDKRHKIQTRASKKCSRTCKDFNTAKELRHSKVTPKTDANLGGLRNKRTTRCPVKLCDTSCPLHNSKLDINHEIAKLKQQNKILEMDLKKIREKEVLAGKSSTTWAENLTRNQKSKHHNDQEVTIEHYSKQHTCVCASPRYGTNEDLAIRPKTRTIASQMATACCGDNDRGALGDHNSDNKIKPAIKAFNDVDKKLYTAPTASEVNDPIVNCCYGCAYCGVCPKCYTSYPRYMTTSPNDNVIICDRNSICREYKYCCDEYHYDTSLKNNARNTHCPNSDEKSKICRTHGRHGTDLNTDHFYCRKTDRSPLKTASKSHSPAMSKKDERLIKKYGVPLKCQQNTQTMLTKNNENIVEENDCEEKRRPNFKERTKNQDIEKIKDRYKSPQRDRAKPKNEEKLKSKLIEYLDNEHISKFVQLLDLYADEKDKEGASDKEGMENPSPAGTYEIKSRENVFEITMKKEKHGLASSTKSQQVYYTPNDTRSPSIQSVEGYTSKTSGETQYSLETLRMLKKMKIIEYKPIKPKAKDTRHEKSMDSAKKENLCSFSRSSGIHEKSQKYKEYVNKYQTENNARVEQITPWVIASDQTYTKGHDDDTYEEQIEAYGATAPTGWDDYRPHEGSAFQIIYERKGDKTVTESKGTKEKGYGKPVQPKGSEDDGQIIDTQNKCAKYNGSVERVQLVYLKYEPNKVDGTTKHQIRNYDTRKIRDPEEERFSKYENKESDESRELNNRRVIPAVPKQDVFRKRQNSPRNETKSPSTVLRTKSMSYTPTSDEDIIRESKTKKPQNYYSVNSKPIKDEDNRFYHNISSDLEKDKYHKDSKNRLQMYSTEKQNCRPAGTHTEKGKITDKSSGVGGSFSKQDKFDGHPTYETHVQHIPRHNNTTKYHTSDIAGFKRQSLKDLQQSETTLKKEEHNLAMDKHFGLTPGKAYNVAESVKELESFSAVKSPNSASLHIEIANDFRQSLQADTKMAHYEEPRYMDQSFNYKYVVDRSFPKQERSENLSRYETISEPNNGVDKGEPLKDLAKSRPQLNEEASAISYMEFKSAMDKEWGFEIGQASSKTEILKEKKSFSAAKLPSTSRDNIKLPTDYSQTLQNKSKCTEWQHSKEQRSLHKPLDYKVAGYLTKQYQDDIPSTSEKLSQQISERNSSTKYQAADKATLNKDPPLLKEETTGTSYVEFKLAEDHELELKTGKSFSKTESVAEVNSLATASDQIEKSNDYSQSLQNNFSGTERKHSQEHVTATTSNTFDALRCLRDFLSSTLENEELRKVAYELTTKLASCKCSTTNENITPLSEDKSTYSQQGKKTTEMQYTQPPAMPDGITSIPGPTDSNISKEEKTNGNSLTKVGKDHVHITTSMVKIPKVEAQQSSNSLRSQDSLATTKLLAKMEEDDVHIATSMAKKPNSEAQESGDSVRSRDSLNPTTLLTKMKEDDVNMTSSMVKIPKVEAHQSGDILRSQDSLATTKLLAKMEDDAHITTSIVKMKKVEANQSGDSVRSQDSLTTAKLLTKVEDDGHITTATAKQPKVESQRRGDSLRTQNSLTTAKLLATSTAMEPTFETQQSGHFLRSQDPLTLFDQNRTLADITTQYATSEPVYEEVYQECPENLYVPNPTPENHNDFYNECVASQNQLQLYGHQQTRRNLAENYKTQYKPSPSPSNVSYSKRNEFAPSGLGIYDPATPLKGILKSCRPSNCLLTAEDGLPIPSVCESEVYQTISVVSLGQEERSSMRRVSTMSCMTEQEKLAQQSEEDPSTITTNDGYMSTYQHMQYIRNSSCNHHSTELPQNKSTTSQRQSQPLNNTSIPQLLPDNLPAFNNCPCMLGTYLNIVDIYLKGKNKMAFNKRLLNY